MRPTQLESRVREIRQHGSEGGAAYSRSDPYIGFSGDRFSGHIGRRFENGSRPAPG